MRLRGAGAIPLLALAILAGCKPNVRGRCNTSTDCRTGTYCSIEGICLSNSGTCTPACVEGYICSGSACAALKPVVSVTAPGGPLSPAFPQVTVHVAAAVAVVLHGIDLEVDSDHSLATGSLGAPQAGDNLVTLTQFQANAVGIVSVRATLHYRAPGASADESVSSVPVPAFIDDVAPTVSVFVPQASDAVNGWVPRTSGTLEVRATVDDGNGSGPQSATLSFDACPAAAPCSYAGTVLSQSGGAAVFSFAVLRSAQAAGSEAPLAVTVKAQDVAGNQGQGAGTVQIDNAPPKIGAFTLVSTTGVVGEDGRTWFIGDNGAAPVEISVPVTDSGAGVGALKLHLDSADLYGGFPTASLDVTGTPKVDGIHFLLPASGVRGQEQHLRFTLTANDLLGNTMSLGPDDPKTMIWVDALPPMIAFAPRVDYVSASSANPQCATPDTPTYRCGRQSSSHLLADDTATVSFDVYDCGVGIISGQPDASVSTKAGGPHAAPVTQVGNDGTPCSNGSTNKTHHYRFTLDLAAQAPVLDPPDLGGTTLVQLVAKALDGLQWPSSRGAPGNAITGDGLALASLWRWKNQVASTAAQPSGSPALIPGTVGQRQIAVGTTLPSTSPNLFVLNADGSPAWSAQVSPGVAADVAAGPTSGKLYVASPAAASCATACSAALNIISAPSSGTMGSAQSCPASNVSFGASPVIALNPERAVVASTNHALAALFNVFVFQTSNCSSAETTLVGTGDYPGVSANWPTLFLATGQGFSSVDRAVGDLSFNTATLTAYNNGSATVTTLSPPSVSNAPVNAFFGSTSDRKVRRAARTCTTGTPCWTDVAGFTPGAAGSGIPFTPVFDSASIYAADDVGKVYTFARSNGAAGWTADFSAWPTTPSPWPSTSPATVSAPLMLQGGYVLVVRNDGVVALASAAGIAPLLKAAPLSGAPVAPAIETRGTGGVAYVSDGQGWVWALQLPAAPLAAGAAVWPRPGRDSCNSRNAASPCL